MPILEINNLSISFGKLHAVSGVSLKVEEGSLTSVIGPNGEDLGPQRVDIFYEVKTYDAERKIDSTDDTRWKGPESVFKRQTDDARGKFKDFKDNRLVSEGNLLKIMAETGTVYDVSHDVAGNPISGPLQVRVDPDNWFVSGGGQYYLLGVCLHNIQLRSDQPDMDLDLLREYADGAPRSSNLEYKDDTGTTRPFTLSYDTGSLLADNPLGSFTDVLVDGALVHPRLKWLRHVDTSVPYRGADWRVTKLREILVRNIRSFPRLQEPWAEEP